MGFYAAQYVFTKLPGGLSTAQICIMQRAAWSCLDETAFLDQPKQWLGGKCGISLRSMERHLPQLAKLEQLVQGDGGFRLPRFLAHHRQIGGRQETDRQFVRQIGGAYKEGFQSDWGDDNKLLSSPWNPDDENAQIEAIGRTFSLNPSLAAIAFFTGVARHYGYGASEPIRSVQFFAQIAKEVVHGKQTGPHYLAYLKRKANEARQGAMVGLKVES